MSRASSPWYYLPSDIIVAGCLVAMFNFGIRPSFGIGLAASFFDIVMADFGHLVPPEKRSSAFGIATARELHGIIRLRPAFDGAKTHQRVRCRRASENERFARIIAANGEPLCGTRLGFVWVMAGEEKGAGRPSREPGRHWHYPELPFNPSLAGCIDQPMPKCPGLLHETLSRSRPASPGTRVGSTQPYMLLTL